MEITAEGLGVRQGFFFKFFVNFQAVKGGTHDRLGISPDGLRCGFSSSMRCSANCPESCKRRNTNDGRHSSITPNSPKRRTTCCASPHGRQRAVATDIQLTVLCRASDEESCFPRGGNMKRQESCVHTPAETEKGIYWLRQLRPSAHGVERKYVLQERLRRG